MVSKRLVVVVYAVLFGDWKKKKKRAAQHTSIAAQTEHTLKVTLTFTYYSQFLLLRAHTVFPNLRAKTIEKSPVSFLFAFP